MNEIGALKKRDPRQLPMNQEVRLHWTLNPLVL